MAALSTEAAEPLHKAPALRPGLRLGLRKSQRGLFDDAQHPHAPVGGTGKYHGGQFVPKAAAGASAKATAETVQPGPGEAELSPKAARVIEWYKLGGKKGAAGLRLFTSPPYKHLFAVDAANQGYFLARGGTLDQKVFAEIIREAKRAGVAAPYRVFGKFATYQSDAMPFEKLPPQFQDLSDKPQKPAAKPLAAAPEPKTGPRPVGKLSLPELEAEREAILKEGRAKGWLVKPAGRKREYWEGLGPEATALANRSMGVFEELAKRRKATEKEARAQEVKAARSAAASGGLFADGKRATYPDGRLVPLLGETVTYTEPGFMGLPTTTTGVVTASSAGLRVKITASRSLIGGESGAGSTSALTPEWTVAGDPELDRRQAARDAAEAAKVTAREEEDRRLAQEAQERTAAAKAGGKKLLSEAKPKVGMRVEFLETGQLGTVTEIDPQYGPAVRWDFEAEQHGESAGGVVGFDNDQIAVSSKPLPKHLTTSALKAAAAKEKHTHHRERFEWLKAEAETAYHTKPEHVDDSLRTYHEDMEILGAQPDPKVIRAAHAAREAARKSQETLQHGEAAGTVIGHAAKGKSKAESAAIFARYKKLWDTGGLAAVVAQARQEGVSERALRKPASLLKAYKPEEHPHAPVGGSGKYHGGQFVPKAGAAAGDPKATIEKILSVVDTRQYEEQGDKFVPVTGSGTPRNCDRCGKVHEVHAEVRLSDGRTLTVGTGCMSKGNTELTSRFQKADRAAKRLAELGAKLKRAEAYREGYRAAQKLVDVLPQPPIEHTGPAFGNPNSPLQEARMGDARVGYRKFDQEREDCLIDAWKDRRLKERGFDLRPTTERELDDLKREIKKVAARTTELGAPTQKSYRLVLGLGKAYKPEEHPHAPVGGQGKYHGGQFVPKPAAEGYGVSRQLDHAPLELPEPVRTQINHDAEVNPKVVEGVVALNRAGITTALSGDLYGQPLVYIDVSPEFASRINAAKLPSRWKLIGQNASTTLTELKGEALTYSGPKGPRVRLARLGTQPITAAEAQRLVGAFESADDGPVLVHQGNDPWPGERIPPRPAPSGGGLFGDDEPAAKPIVHPMHAQFPPNGGVHEIPHSAIEPDWSQDRAREEFSEGKIAELAESLKRGLDQPIIVRPQGDHFQIIAGERRWTAAKLLGWKTIRAQVRVVDDREAADIQLRENTARKDLNPMEEAKAFENRIKRFGMAPEEIAKIAGKSTSYVQGRLALNNLTPGFQVLLQSGDVKVTWGGLIAKLSKPSQDALLSEMTKWPEEKWTQANVAIAVQERAQAESQSAWDFGDDPLADITGVEGVGKGRVDKERVKLAKEKGEKLILQMGKLLEAFEEDDLHKLLPLAMATRLGPMLDVLERQRGALDGIIENMKAAKASRDTTGSFARYVKTANIKATSEEVQSRVSERVGTLQKELGGHKRRLKKVEEELLALRGKRGVDPQRQALVARQKELKGHIERLDGEKAKVRSVLRKAVAVTMLSEDRAEVVARVNLFKSIPGIWLIRSWEEARLAQVPA